MINEKTAKKYYEEDFVSHGFDHLRRVQANALKIAKTEKVNMKVLKAAAWFHDVARPDEFKTGVDHAKLGSKKVIPILEEMKFSQKEINEVSKSIAEHRFTKGIKATSIESKILQDADRLDALGAIAIARIFAHGGHKGESLEKSATRFPKKQLKLKPSTFNTKEGKKIAKEKYEFTKEFYERFLNEKH